MAKAVPFPWVDSEMLKILSMHSSCWSLWTGGEKNIHEKKKKKTEALASELALRHLCEVNALKAQSNY